MFIHDRWHTEHPDLLPRWVRLVYGKITLAGWHQRDDEQFMFSSFPAVAGDPLLLSLAAAPAQNVRRQPARRLVRQQPLRL
jgi:hypothetical protein